MHIPAAPSCELEIMSFCAALEQEQNTPHDYDQEQWLYVPCTYAEYRYILGTKGKKPLICIGVNPSTARPNDLDNTLKSVERIARHNGFDSFIMFNVYAQRATSPDDMDTARNEMLHNENMQAFRYILENAGEHPAIWAAWGAVIEKRRYLPACVRDMIKAGEAFGARWYTAGTRSKQKGHPHHPLYLKKDSLLDPFDDILAYLDTL
ncbi:MAG: DUF1643 domain-containing protein [Elusimicrobiaceae bacterium]|nr:DUF1643 domain-containing protein [Clostridia bacterium]MBP3514503.1 DUF1643 domain-containing protein [Elusimicrobiaceae bacterium]